MSRGCSGCINFLKFKPPTSNFNHGGMCDVYDWNVKADSKPKECKYFNPIPYNRVKQKLVTVEETNVLEFKKEAK